VEFHLTATGRHLPYGITQCSTGSSDAAYIHGYSLQSKQYIQAWYRPNSAMAISCSD